MRYVRAVPEFSMPRSDGLTILVALEEAIGHAMTTSVYALVITLQDAAGLLLDRLFPDLPEGND